MAATVFNVDPADIQTLDPLQLTILNFISRPNWIRVSCGRVVRL